MVTSGWNGLNQVVSGGTGLRILKTNGSIGSSELSNSVAEVAFQWLLPLKVDPLQPTEPIAVKSSHDPRTFYDSASVLLSLLPAWG